MQPERSAEEMAELPRPDAAERVVCFGRVGQIAELVRQTELVLRRGAPNWAGAVSEPQTSGWWSPRNSAITAAPLVSAIGW